MEITSFGASHLSQLIYSKQVSCQEVMQASLDRIAVVNPRVNAIVNLRSEEDLLKEAAEHDALLAKGASKGWLHGIPQAIKDIAPSAGLPNTMGSPLLRDFIPKEDGLMVQRMKAAGCIVIGKTNVPEFGLGSHSFNEVFGATRNAYDLSKTAGGSSGGAAVALNTCMLSVADGSDFMGSLRNPAAWGNVFGMRPSQGRVPMWPATDVWINQLGTEGPMARDVASLAALLQTQSGYSPLAPLSIALCADSTPSNGQFGLKNQRIGWLGDMNAHLATEPGVLALCEQALQRMMHEGAHVSPCTLSMPPAQVWEAWSVWRKALVGSRLAPFMLSPSNRDKIKPEALWEYDSAQDLKAAELMRASVSRTAFYQAMLQLFEQHDFLALPAVQVWPFPIEQRWPKEILTAHGARAMDTYHRWMECTIYATFAGLPAISLPCGFSEAGLPMGIQIIGKPQADSDLLALAQAYEATAQDVLQRRPALG
ncbi:amidase [Variovorax sp. PCZ-1]|uniref:amidase n=1 Tax=Variovorax sp. PCZ-1 TaxID=2835533 RepID=UPI001BCC582D|nr:amidase [Variovorax sp. PCZ-1]MBS7809162.1 amidase [Variovorax sp. PCZ-1]